MGSVSIGQYFLLTLPEQITLDRTITNLISTGYNWWLVMVQSSVICSGNANKKYCPIPTLRITTSIKQLKYHSKPIHTDITVWVYMSSVWGFEYTPLSHTHQCNGLTLHVINLRVWIYAIISIFRKYHSKPIHTDITVWVYMSSVWGFEYTPLSHTHQCNGLTLHVINLRVWIYAIISIFRYGRRGLE